MIGSWNYRRCKQKQIDDFNIETTRYFIAEVYYTPDDKIVGWSDEFDGLKENDSEKSLTEEFDKIKKAFKEPILDLDVIEIHPLFIDSDEEFYDYNEI